MLKGLNDIMHYKVFTAVPDPILISQYKLLFQQLWSLLFSSPFLLQHMENTQVQNN